ncbi:Hcp family type VI secretion system effector [Pseudomonas defluvii]|uniref:type VI secretion system tube protein Hcp n=1 Tax=Pseudomonas defluvii TaxID=1876757 RepID=UPI0039065752
MILVKFEPEIIGTSTVKGYENWIVFESYSINSARHIQVHGDDRDVSNAHVSELMLTKGADKTSPEFFIQAKIGTAFTKATVVSLHAAGPNKPLQRMLSLELSKPIVSSYATQGSSGNRPSEHISLNFSAIKYEYHYFDGGERKGSAEKSYNLISNGAPAA